MTKHAATSDGQPDFSLVLGGPLFQLFRRAHLSGDALDCLRRRILVISCVAWVPLLVLSVIEGHAVDGAIKISFLRDIEAHVRFLIALPILVGAELIVHLRLRPAVQLFEERGMLSPSELPKFRAAIESTLRLRNSPIVEALLLVLVYAVGLWIWRSQIALGGASWYARPDTAGLHPTLAGYWYAFVSLPFFQFILLRWYLRFFLWFMFLWRVSRLNLRLVPTHPDRAAGLGFLGKSAYAFGPILFAQGALLAGVIASQIFHADQGLTSFKVQIAGSLAFFLTVVLSPLVAFTPHLIRAKRNEIGSFGKLAGQYAREFEEKWFDNAARPEGELLGSADIQSLADLGNSYGIVQEMRLVPFGWRDVTRLAATAAVPLLPLTLTIFSFEDLITQLVHVLF